MKDLRPSLLGCGGVITLLGLILLILFRDQIGANVFLMGVGMMAAILLFWSLSYAYRFFKNKNPDM